MAGKGPGKKLFSSLMENDESDIQNDDTIKVFLRLKPPKNKEEAGVVEVLDSRTVIFKMPSEYAQFKKKLNMPDEFKYTFSTIYREDSTQGDIFTGCVGPLVKDLFVGQNCLLFTYGTTNAGKTFTVLGNGDHPGIIPRTLTTVFKSIRGKEYGSAKIKPDMFNSAVEITDAVLEEELVFKKKILTWNPERTMNDPSRTNKTSSSSRPSVDDYIGETVFREMQKRLTNDTSIVEYQADSQDRFSVWVSFGEIYNENIYDLLMPVNINKKRKALKLASDKYRNVYIKGLKHVFVQSEEEAYKVLMFGKNNLQVAATGMNLHSSRSHCIFTIKLIKIPNVENPERVVVSSFAICDLAGAERQKKTLNVGLRLKESQNINCSLHVLSRCFTVLRENQLHNKNELIPFRDSKLTQLFQHALMGKESVTMIVNVNQEKHLCQETQHVLKATAVAKHIVVLPRIAQKPPRLTRTSMFSHIISKHNRSTLIRWDSCVKPKEVPNLIEDSASELAQSQLEEKEAGYESLLVLVENLKEKLQDERNKHLETKKAARRQEDRIREEMTSKFEQLMKEAQENNEYDKKRARKLVLEATNKPDDKSSTKKAKVDYEERLSKNLPDEIKELSEEIKNQKLEIEALTDFVNTLREEKKEVTMELTSAKIDLGWKDQEIESLKHQIQIFGEEGGLKAAYVALQKEMEMKVKSRDNLLEEARTDLLDEQSQKDDLEEELVKLEKELIYKEEEVLNLQSKLENMEKEIKGTHEMLDMLSRDLDNVEEERDELEIKSTKLEEELKAKEDLISKLQLEEANLKKGSEETNRKLEELEKLKSKEIEMDQQLKELVKEKEDASKEISTLEQSLKQQIQETTKMMESKFEKTKEVDHLRRELHKAKVSSEELGKMLKNKTQELAGLEKQIITLQTRESMQKQELDECKTKDATIRNMEQEMVTFQANQQEIVSKYEQQLKKSKEENEGLKKEVSKLANTFNRLTPTPKQDLQNQIEELKKTNDVLEKERADLQQQLQQRTENQMQFNQLGSDTNKEYEEDDVFVNNNRMLSEQSNAVTCPGAHSVKEVAKPRLEKETSKSASKAKPRRTRAANNVPVDISDGDNDSKPEKPARTIRRKLLDTTSTTSLVQLDDNDDEINIPQNSPGTVIHRSLRSRPHK